jgi:hypothetical protein
MTAAAFQTNGPLCNANGEHTGANPTKSSNGCENEKLRKMLAYLDNMEEPEELRTLAAWHAQPRLTFRIDTIEREICDVNLEDYH